MSDDIKFDHLSDREILILTAQAVSSHGKRLDAHSDKIADLQKWRWINTGAFAVLASLFKIRTGD